ncbi:MAG: hypothetical protein AAFZ63_24800 [Bacteroidota bacterium]
MSGIKYLLGLWAYFVLILPGNTQTPNTAYTIQENDWLSSVAERAYDNPHLYHRIIEGTNRKAETDNTFTRINQANQIQVGQKVFIPAAPTTTNLAGIPQTNCEIRLWYNYQVVAIGVINQKWEEEGVDLETRAHRAYELRHEARVNARYLMTDKATVKVLQDRDMAKYGNPDGPTFEYLLKKNTDNGITLEEAYQSIIDSSSRTDTRYNADCQ